MFEKILLTKDGCVKLVETIKQKEIVSLIPKSKILRALSENSIVLEDGFTLRSYFKIFEKYPILKELEDWIDEHIDEVKKAPEYGCVFKDMPKAYIQLSKNIELDTTRSKREIFDENGNFDFNTKNIYVVDEKTATVNFDISMIDPESENKEHYAIEMSPLKELLDIPIIINREINVRKLSISKTGTYRIKSLAYDSEYGVNLYSFITEIIKELSFFGSPENRQLEREEIQRRVDEVENGTAKFVSMEELSESLNKVFKDEKEIK